MKARILAWFDRLNAVPEPEPVVTVAGSLVLEPNPRVRQAVVKAELSGMNRREIERALELFHEYYLAEMGKAVRPRAEGERPLVLTEHEAPLAVIRGMAVLMAELSEEIKVLAEEPKKGLVSYG